MSKPTIFLTRRWPEPVERALQANFTVQLNDPDNRLDAKQLQQAFNEFDAICPCVADTISAEQFATGSCKAKIIANYGVGFNNIAYEKAAAQGITVTNTPDVLSDATAELAMTLMLMVARRGGEGERHVRTDTWQGWYPTHMMGTQVTGKTLGIVGMGRIGIAMAQKAQQGFGMKILYHNRRQVDLADTGLEAQYCADLEELLEGSDFISLHCPSTAETRHMINSGTLASFRPGSYLINTSRGDVVDESALLSALESGQIRGAGLDVFEHEPEVPDSFKNMENVVLLPHLGSATIETRIAMGMRVLQNLEAFFRGETPPDKVA